jgi:flavin-dependent dehydrogenase
LTGTYDVLVAGGGTAGCALAARLSEANTNLTTAAIAEKLAETI